MTAKQVSESLSIRQFLSLCNTVDLSRGKPSKFDVLHVKRVVTEPVIEILVCYEEGDVQQIKIAA